MAGYVISADGTRIAYDRIGAGYPVVLISGLLCDRQTLQELAERLASEFSVISYDRRGRGESGDAPRYGVAREIEDLGALIAAAGGSAAVYGHSSGAGLALNAAACTSAITRLVLHEPPYGGDDDEVGAARGNLPRACACARAGSPGRRGETVLCGLRATRRGGRGARRRRKAARSRSHDDLPAVRITGMLPDGKLAVLEDQDHGASAAAVAPVVAEFLAGSAANSENAESVAS